MDDLDEVLEDIDLPDEIVNMEKTVRNDSILLLESEPASNDISDYTPTANLKATIEEKTERVDEEEQSDGLWSQSGMQTTAAEEEDVELEQVTYAGFKGYGEDVLFNTTLQYPMFKVLCQIALEAESGGVTGIVVKDGEMFPVQIVDGEERPASVTVVEDEEAPEPGSWRDNEFI